MAEKKTTKKVATKKVAEKKPAAKKVATKKAEAPKKATAKKAPAKKTAAKKPVAKKKALTAKDYEKKINAKKQEAHDKNWLYIEVNAGELNREFEKDENLEAVCTAMTDLLLEGDCFIIDPLGTSPDLTVRYYVDNLSPERKKYYDVK